MLAFTGERWIPGESPAQVEKDHLARYQFASQFVKNKSVLDIACGAGYGSKLLKEAGARLVHGVELDPETLNFARSYQVEGLEYRFGNICTLTSEIEYQVIVCLETIEHTGRYRVALKNLNKLLAPDGLLIISTPHRARGRALTDKPENPFHTQEFTTKELAKELEQDGFKVTGYYGQHQRGGSERVTRLAFKDDRPKYIVLVAEK